MQIEFKAWYGIGSLRGKDCKEYRNFKTQLSTIVKGIRANLLIWTMNSSVLTLSNSKHRNAINGTDPDWNRATILLRSVLTQIKDGPFSNSKDSYYMKFVRALQT